MSVRAHLLSPDGSALVADGGAAASPVVLAGSLAAAVAGAGLFAGAAATGLPSTGVGVAPMLGGALVAGLLTFPPLMLASAIFGRKGTVLHLAAASAVGPAVAGAWLAASSPVVLLHGLGVEPGPGFILLVALLAMLAFGAGGLAAVKRAWKGGPTAPGVLTAFFHYLLTAWTALVVALHLA